MLRYSLSILALCFIYFQSSQDAECQTIKKRSEVAYSKLGTSTGAERVKILSELAYYRSSDSMGRARELAWEAYNYSAKTKQGPDIANALLSLARVYYNAGIYDSAKMFLTRSLRIKISLHNVTGLDQAYFIRGLILQQEGKYKEAVSKHQIGLQYAILSNNTALQARCYTEMANCHKILNQTSEMNRSIEAALVSLKKGGDSLLVSNAYGHLGLLQNDLGRLENAVSSYIRAIRIAEVLCDSLALGYMYSNLSGVYGSFNAPHKSNEYNLKALQVFKNTGNKRGMAYALNSLGITASGLGETAKALKYYLEAGKLKVAVADWQGACFIYNNLADLYIKTSNLPLAEKFLQIGGFYTEKAGDMLSRVVFLNTSGHYYSAIHDHTRARKFYEESLYLAETLKLHDFITSNLESISAEYDAEEKPDEALAFFKKYTARKDSVASLNDRKVIAEMQVKYDTEKKESQIKEMSRLIMNSSVKNRSFLTGNLAIGILILTVFFYFFYRTRFRMKYEHKIIAESAGIMPESLHHSVIPLPDQASKPILTPDQQKVLWQDLNELMNNEKAYLNGNLKLSDLATRLNTNTSYLSKVINELSGENFCNYLNHLRVSEARHLLADPANQHITIEGIAQTVGFNSKSAFNTAFKKYTAQTPSEYLSASVSKEKSTV